MTFIIIRREWETAKSVQIAAHAEFVIRLHISCRVSLLRNLHRPHSAISIAALSSRKSSDLSSRRLLTKVEIFFRISTFSHVGLDVAISTFLPFHTLVRKLSRSGRPDVPNNFTQASLSFDRALGTICARYVINQSGKARSCQQLPMREIHKTSAAHPT